MDECDTKTCSNCKREIPAVNYTTHSVHCARNIRVCPVCKEPVPLSDLDDHHDKFHKMLPCKHCGESVCGTDLEDHIRDSCAHTVKCCRFCELELARRELPAHEGYCGARTEQCAQCREWVMLKYRQLHLDSNHGFLRLDDDPAPHPKPPPQLTGTPKNINAVKPLNVPSAATSNGRPASGPVNVDQARPLRYFNGYGDAGASGSSGDVAAPSAAHSPARVPAKRTNDQPQVNTDVAAVDKIYKEFRCPPRAAPASRGAVKKRAAPAPPADPRRDLALHSALQRKQREDAERAQQSAYNLSIGLPPVLSPAEKLEKLRKIDALHSRETQQPDCRGGPQGAVWMAADAPAGHVLGSRSSQDDDEANQNGPLVAQAQRDNLRLNNVQAQKAKLRINKAPVPGVNLRPKNSQAQHARNQPPEVDMDEFKNLTPMSPEEFILRFNELQMRREGGDEEGGGAAGGDRFSQIKSSLRELRRGLNEVTAPYNSANGNGNLRDGEIRARRRSPRASPPPPADPGEVRLPCEFCDRLVPCDDLVQHQTGCRPDLTRFLPRSPRRSPPRSPSPEGPPVIPCEFCTESLPVYLITEHQERCRRDNNALFAD